MKHTYRMTPQDALYLCLLGPWLAGFIAATMCVAAGTVYLPEKAKKAKEAAKK